MIFQQCTWDNIFDTLFCIGENDNYAFVDFIVDCPDECLNLCRTLAYNMMAYFKWKG
jgi:hypothetical protein